MEKSKVVSLASYRERKPVTLSIHADGTVWDHNPVITAATILNHGNGACIIGYNSVELDALPSGIDSDVTFAHVLNVPESEDFWSGDAAKMLYPELFACRLSNEWLYTDTSFLAEHKRCEIQRLSSGGFYELTYYEYDFDCYKYGAYPCLISDGCEDEVDTLDSVLLLTQEYEPPTNG